MEIFVGLIVVLAVAAFLGRGSQTSTVRTAALPTPAPSAIVRDRADDAFITGYVIGRHTRAGETGRTDHPPAEPLDDDCDPAACALSWYDDAEDWDDA